MGKPTNIATTSHAQAAEFAALAGVASESSDTTGLKNALRDSIAKQTELDGLLHDETVAHAVTADELTAARAELVAEKEAHAATQAALDAATKTEA